MSAFGDAFTAMKNVILMQERLERMQMDVTGLAEGLDGLQDFTHDLDKRLYALERIVDLGARQSQRSRPQQKRIEE